MTKQTKARKPRAVWLLRGSSYYHLWPSKAAFVQTRDYIEAFCPHHFERITGYRLEPGECKRVRVSVEEVTR